MATVAPTGDGAQAAAAVNNGGTLLNPGNHDSSVITNGLRIDEINGASNGVLTGSRVLAKTGTGASTTDRAGVQTALGAGTLAYFPDARAAEGSNRNFLVRGAGHTNAGKINNSASDLVAMPAADRHSQRGPAHIHDSLVNRNRGVYAINVLAAPSTEIHPERTITSPGVAANYVAPTGDGTVAASDDAANPTRAIPGELTYPFGGLAKPTTDVYKPSDVYES